MSGVSDHAYPLVFSADSPLIAVYRTLEKIRENPTTVLMEGESGTGKDGLAHWLHYNSPRKDSPLITIRIPPLRERRNEIFPMAEFLLAQLDRKYKMTSRLSVQCQEVFEQYEFPGNIRELRNALERVILMGTGQQITPDAFPSSWTSAPRSASKMPSLEDMERTYIIEVLRKTRGKKVKAAKILGISRKTLLEKRKKFGLE